MTRARAGLERRTAILLAVFAVCLVSASSAQAAPGNDDIADRITLGGPLPIVQAGTTVDATQEPGEPDHTGQGAGGNHSVWYSFQAPSSASYRIDTCNSPASSSVPAVYDGETIATLGPRLNGGAFSLCGTSDVSLTFSAVANETYSIAVDNIGVFGGPGAFELRIREVVPNVAPVCNDVSYTVESNQPLFLPIVGPCTDADGPAPLQGSANQSAQGVTVQPGPNGGGTYRSPLNFVGTDTVVFRANDGESVSNDATATINVIPEQPNEAPECPSGTAFVPEGGSVTIYGNCTDAENNPVSYTCCYPGPAGGSYFFVFNPIGITYTPSAGTTSTFFTYRANDARHAPMDVTVPIEVVPASQRDYESAPDSSPAEPFVAAITTTRPGYVTIDARQVTATAPTGYTLLDQEFDIEAPSALSDTDPLRLTFEIDVNEVPAGPITVFRDEIEVRPCTGAPGVAFPDPCALPPVTQGDGDVTITVLSTHASVWNLAVRVAPQTKDDCKKDGWKAYGTFKNQGDCVSFVATKGTNRPSGG